MEYAIKKIICVEIKRDSVVVGIVEKSKSLDFTTMLVFWSLVSLIRNSVVLAVYLLFSVACFFTVHEHMSRDFRRIKAAKCRRIYSTVPLT